MRKLLILLTVMILLISSGCQKKLSTEGKTEVQKKEILIENQDLMTEEILKQCQHGTAEEPVILVDPYHISPLSALISFETETESEVEVIVKGKSEGTDLKWNYPAEKNHLIAITGLVPQEPTTVQLSVEGQTYEYQITGNPLPEGALEAEVTIGEQLLEPNELIFTTPSSLGYPTAYDSQGEIRWILNEVLFWDSNLLEEGLLTLSSNRLLASPYYTTGFTTLDLLGHIHEEYTLPGGYHHDIDELENGNFLVATNDLNGDTVEDHIVELDRETGEIVTQFDMEEVLPMDQGKSLNWTKEDWFHNNSVDYNPELNILTVSGRHQDVIAILDYTTKELKALVGSDEGWPEEMKKYFLEPQGEDFEWQWAQHAATWLDDKHLMCFDNGMNRSKTEENAVKAEDNYSRMVIYEVDMEQKTIRQVKEYGKERGRSYYSPYISDADMIGDDQWLVTSGGISWKDGKINNMPGSQTEYDKMEAYLTVVRKDQAVFELKIPANIYRSEMIDVSAMKMAPLQSAQRKGNLGITRYETSVEEKLNFHKAEKMDEKLTENISFAKEVDRLILTATLHKHDDLDLLLVQDDQMRVYTVQTDTQPGVCVGFFNQPGKSDYSTLVQTISAEGLKGQWHLYLLFNDRLIDTEELYTVE